MNYLNKLNELGLTEDSISASLKKKIQGYKKLEAKVLEFKEALDTGELEGDDLEVVTESYNNASDDLRIEDEELVKAIVKFDANKERYAEQAKNLKPKTKKVQEPTPQPEPQPQPEPTPVAAVEEKKESSSGLGWLVGGLVTVALAAVGINYLKNK